MATITELVDQLRRDQIVAEEAEAKYNATKDTLLAAMLAKTDSPETIRTDWGQIQPVRSVEWIYRCAAVTAQDKIVAKAEKALKEAKALLKGALAAAKAANKAKEGKVSWSLRVVKGK